MDSCKTTKDNPLGTSNQNTSDQTKIITVEDGRNKIKIMEADNQRINEQLFALQNKFYVQTKILNEKNTEFSQEVQSTQKIKNERDQILKESQEYEKQLELLTQSNKQLKSENAKLKKEGSEISGKYNDISGNINYTIGKLEEEKKCLLQDNKTLKESTTKGRTQLDFVINDMKLKESKMIYTFENEKKEIEQNLRSEIFELKQKNEDGLLESKQLRQEKANYDETAVQSMKNSQEEEFQKAEFIIVQQKQKIEGGQEINAKYQEHIKAMEEAGIINDKKLKAIKLDLQQSEKDTKHYYEVIQQKEGIIEKIKMENIKFASELEKTKNLDTGMVELQEKNQTISFLLNEKEEIKHQNTIELQEKGKRIQLILKEKDSLSQKLEKAHEEIYNINKDLQGKIEDMKQENEIGLNDLNNKEIECNEGIGEKVQGEAKYNEQFRIADGKCDGIKGSVAAIQQENKELKNKINELIEISTNKYEELTDNLIKSKKKIETLTEVHNKHIQYMKERFDNIGTDISKVFNLKANPQEGNEKFDKLFNNLRNSIDLVNQISEREALLENFKSELKKGNNTLSVKKSKITAGKTENINLSHQLNIRKLQNKAKPSENYDMEKKFITLTSILHDISDKNELTIKLNDLEIENKCGISEIKLLKDKLQSYQEIEKTNKAQIFDLTSQLAGKAKEINDNNKTYKREIKTLLDEVKNIKDNWTPLDRKMEYLKTIEEGENNLKQAKEELTRRKEMGTNLKNKNDKLTETIQNFQTSEQITNELNDKIKQLKKEIIKKDTLIKDTKESLETGKQENKILNEEKEKIIESSKLRKVELKCKEQFISDLQKKMNQVTTDMDKNSVKSNTSMIMQTTANLQKLKSENERKDNGIKTLKIKNETLVSELNQIKTSGSQGGNSNNEQDKEMKQHIKDKTKLDKYLLTIEQMSSCIRKIFNDMQSTFAKENMKDSIGHITNSMKEGMNIGGVRDSEVIEFLNPSSRGKDFEKRVNFYLDSKAQNFDCENMILIYNEGKEGINKYKYDTKIHSGSNNISNGNYNRINCNSVLDREHAKSPFNYLSSRRQVLDVNNSTTNNSNSISHTYKQKQSE